MLKAVIFDVDGTLVDSVDLHAKCWEETFEHFGYQIPYPEIRYQIGKGGDKLLATFLSATEIDQKGHEIEDFRSDLFKRKYFSECQPFPGVPELFKHLRGEGLMLALASSGKKTEVEKYQKLLGIENLVQEATCGDDVDASKPDPDVLQDVREKLGGIEAADCLFVGDSPHDALAAKKDGMPMIGLLCGGFSEDNLKQQGAMRTYQNPADLLSRWDEEKSRAAE